MPTDQFFPAAARIVERVTGKAVEHPAFEVTAWELHGAAFTAAASSETLGLVHGAYYVIIHGEPTLATGRPECRRRNGYAAPPVDPLRSLPVAGDGGYRAPDPGAILGQSWGNRK